MLRLRSPSAESSPKFHGEVDILLGWAGKTPPELLAAYEEAIAILDVLDLNVAHSTIDKPKLHSKYDGSADENAYRLALQFLARED